MRAAFSRLLNSSCASERVSELLNEPSQPDPERNTRRISGCLFCLPPPPLSFVSSFVSCPSSSSSSFSSSSSIRVLSSLIRCSLRHDLGNFTLRHYGSFSADILETQLPINVTHIDTTNLAREGNTVADHFDERVVNEKLR